MSLTDQFLLFAIAFVANLFSALAGGGAGLLQLPALIFLGLPFGVALGTHKVASVALGVGATIRHLREGRLNSRLTLYILASGLPGVVLGAHVIITVPDRAAECALGILTTALAVYSYLRPQLGLEYSPRNRSRRGYVVGALVLFLIGLLNGSLTSGTGLFVTLWLVRWFGLDYRQAVAYTLILVGLFWNGAGALTLGLLREIHWQWLPALLLGSLLGGYGGAHLAILKGNRWVKPAFETIAFTVGVRLIIG